MTHLAVTPKDIAKAQAGTITTPLLRHLRGHAYDAHAGQVSEDGALLLLLCAGPALDELLLYREQREAALDVPLPDALGENVIPLRGDAS